MTEPSSSQLSPLSPETIAQRIYLIRGFKVMLDRQLAELYDVPTSALNQAVKRNWERFPNDFMFQLTEMEMESLRSQFVILDSSGRGRYSKYLPYAFTEQGVAMLSAVLKSPTAVRMNIEIMRVFVKLREMIVSNTELSRKLSELEKKYDAQFKTVFDAIRHILTPPVPPKRPIGFLRQDKE